MLMHVADMCRSLCKDQGMSSVPREASSADYVSVTESCQHARLVRKMGEEASAQVPMISLPKARKGGGCQGPESG